ncbi:MAG: Uma2 family endonuclease [Chloroflexota bacterium]
MVVPAPRRFSVDEYYRMAEVGILGDDDRVELIEGEIVEMAPVGPAHAGDVDGLTELFVTRLRGRAIVRVQGPIRLDQHSEPQPDLAILRRPAEQPSGFRASHPSPSDVLLLIEVSDTSLVFDLGTKASLYARSGVVELWVVNLKEESLVVHRKPTDHGYSDVTVLRSGDRVAPIALPDLTIDVAELLG